MSKRSVPPEVLGCNPGRDKSEHSRVAANILNTRATSLGKLLLGVSARAVVTVVVEIPIDERTLSRTALDEGWRRMCLDRIRRVSFGGPGSGRFHSCGMRMASCACVSSRQRTV